MNAGKESFFQRQYRAGKQTLFHSGGRDQAVLFPYVPREFRDLFSVISWQYYRKVLRHVCRWRYADVGSVSSLERLKIASLVTGFRLSLGGDRIKVNQFLVDPLC